MKLLKATRPFIPAAAACAVAALGHSAAGAATLPMSVVSMSVNSAARTCQITSATNCFNTNQFAADFDTQSSFGSFIATSVASSVLGTESPTHDAFPASASASTTLGANNAFNAHLVTDRATVAPPYTGSYVTNADTQFSFTTLAAGTMSISYSVQYERPSNDSTLGAGFSYNSSAGSDGQSASPTGLSLSGLSTGTWVVPLQANVTYFVTLSANNSRQFTVSPPSAYGRDLLDATYNVSFAAAVPEPGSWAMLAAGLVVLGGRRALSQRRARG